MSWRLSYLLLFLACVGMIAFALYHQYVHWLMPCLMCIYQRLAITLFGLLSLLCVFWQPKTRGGVRFMTTLLSLSALGGAAAAAWNVRLQFGPSDPSLACAATLPFPVDLNTWPSWAASFVRPVGDCSVVDFTVFGVSMPVWVLLTCLALVVVVVGIAKREMRLIERRRWR
ncbi:disulfide bond formation protein B [Chitinibacteraceae bacterium HSL-7]